MPRFSRILISFLVLLAAYSSLPYSASAESPILNNGKIVLLLEIDGAIGPATRDYILHGLEQAEIRGAELLIIQLDTPGGLDNSMRDIIKSILLSPVPVALYVAPSGARAASAGTYMLYASHIAAMAPGTNLGAATPVQMGGTPQSPDSGSGEGDNGQSAEKPESKTSMERKIINDAAAYLRSLAQMRGRNAEWTEQAVREGASLSAEEAVELKVIDFLAQSPTELVSKSDGRRLRMSGDQERVLDTQGAVIERLEMDWRTRFLSVITDPNVAYMLMLLGFYGLIYEFLNPGMYLPGVIGAICLLLALYALQVLPINYAGLALMLLGISFMVAEAFMPSFGIVGIGGIIAFTVGSVILLDDEGYRISIPMIIGNAVISAVLFIWILGAMFKLRRKPGPLQENMVDEIGEAREDFAREGYILLRGELWKVISETPVRRGQKVRVKSRQGLSLLVEPMG